jgi:Ca2+-binding RTX toxin-like protein
LGGNDSLYGGSGDDTFVGGSGNDTIYARSNQEGGGNKTVVWNAGDGNDTVYYYNPTRVAGDKQSILKFGEGISLANVAVSNSGSNVIFIVTLLSGSGRVTFVNANTTDPSYQPDEIQFADGTVRQWAEISRQ